MTAEHDRLEESPEPNCQLAAVGPLSRRTAMGDRARRLFGNRRMLDVFSPRPCPQPRLSLGRGRPLGICDRECRLCFALTLWNGQDPILKERLFGLTGPEGNHAEDVKEIYFYVDSSPTHSYLKGLYKYPQAAFPYEWLVAENRRRGKRDREFELVDTGIFKGNRYFDVVAEYAKANTDDILIRITVANRGPESATLHLLPTLWFRNSWSWGCTHEGCEIKPRIEMDADGGLRAKHVSLGTFRFFAETMPGSQAPPYLFTENETNYERLFQLSNGGRPVKDAFQDFVVDGKKEALSPRPVGTKAAPTMWSAFQPGGETVIRSAALCRGPGTGQTVFRG